MNNQSANVKFSTQTWTLLIIMDRQEDLYDWTKKRPQGKAHEKND